MTQKKHGHPQERKGADHKDPQHRRDEPKQRGIGHKERGERSNEDPEKKIQIDDNPDETKKKIPHME